MRRSESYYHNYHKIKANPFFNRRNRFSMLDFLEKTGGFAPLRDSSSCCAYTVQLQSQCDILGWAMGLPSDSKIACDKKLRDEI